MVPIRSSGLAGYFSTHKSMRKRWANQASVILKNHLIKVRPGDRIAIVMLLTSPVHDFSGQEADIVRWFRWFDNESMVYRQA
jgi:hypothetical protein